LLPYNGHMYTCDNISDRGRRVDVTSLGICSSWRVVKSATSNSYWLLKRDREFEREKEIEIERKQLSAGEVGQEQIPRLGGAGGKKSCRHIGS